MKTELVVVETDLMCRKTANAIPVPGPIGGGSLSNWKEAEHSKDHSKEDNKDYSNDVSKDGSNDGK